MLLDGRTKSLALAHASPNHDRQHRLKGDLAYKQVNGVMLERWQLEVTGGGRIWYAVNSSTMEVWLIYASTKHSKATDD